MMLRAVCKYSLPFGYIVLKFINNIYLLLFLGVDMFSDSSNFKRLLGATLIVGLGLGLVACGGGGSASSTPATSGACATASNCTLPSSVAGVPPQN